MSSEPRVSSEPRIQREASWNRRPVAQAPTACATYPATSDAVHAARSDVARIARDAGASQEALADIKIAVSEASTNAVIHAYVSPGKHGATFTISTATNGPRLSVWVTDEGKGGPPDIPSSGLGLGLQLMARLCERVLIGVLKDGRTQVEMRFDLRAARSHARV